MTTERAPVLLVILDGWGLAPDGPGNAVAAAHTPVMDRLLATYPYGQLMSSGEEVGLPAGQMGNSEVGHLNIGAGFVVYQWITRLDRAIADRSFFANPALLEAMRHAKAHGSRLHLLGLVSEGGVHSHTRHLEALLRMAADQQLADVAVHAFTDGRDTLPTSGTESVARLESSMKSIGIGRIVTVSGRYYAMDRDQRWERTQRAFNAVALGEGPSAPSAGEAISNAYRRGMTDEFVEPTVISSTGEPYAGIGPDDAVMFFNFRSDRCRQLASALAEPAFAAFDRATFVPPVSITTMTTYDATLPVTVAFPPHDVVWPLARAISAAGRTQFHAAETEKYPHVTFFLNGGREEPFPGEERSLTPSPKVATYDLQPEMSALEVSAAVKHAIAAGVHDAVIVNFANGDMVGHTGDFAATVTAIETVDRCLGDLLDELDRAGGHAIVTADHGNAEEMIDEATGGPMTSHTTNPVPLIVVSPDGSAYRHATIRPGAVLSAIAPTMLELMGIDPPADMTRASLIVRPD